MGTQVENFTSAFRANSEALVDSSRKAPHLEEMLQRIVNLTGQSMESTYAIESKMNLIISHGAEPAEQSHQKQAEAVTYIERFNEQIKRMEQLNYKLMNLKTQLELLVG